MFFGPQGTWKNFCLGNNESLGWSAQASSETSLYVPSSLDLITWNADSRSFKNTIPSFSVIIFLTEFRNSSSPSTVVVQACCFLPAVECVLPSAWRSGPADGLLAKEVSRLGSSETLSISSSGIDIGFICSTPPRISHHSNFIFKIQILSSTLISPIV